MANRRTFFLVVLVALSLFLLSIHVRDQSIVEALRTQNSNPPTKLKSNDDKRRVGALGSVSLESSPQEAGKQTSPSRSQRFKEASDPRPSGLRLAIVGDSVSRYHYNVFAYFLRYGGWYQPFEKEKHSQ